MALGNHYELASDKVRLECHNKLTKRLSKELVFQVFYQIFGTTTVCSEI